MINRKKRYFSLSAPRVRPSDLPLIKELADSGHGFESDEKVRDSRNSGPLCSNLIGRRLKMSTHAQKSNLASVLGADQKKSGVWDEINMGAETTS